jgi:nucleoside-diphosphate-sugar epimerase
MNQFWQSRRALVLGAAGFGGSHLCSLLSERGAQVLAFDRVPRFESSVCDASQVLWLPGDLRDAEGLKLLVERYEPEFVFLIAAQPIVSISNALPLETAQVNIMGAYNALEACRVSRKTKKLVFASSGAYYGATQAEDAIGEEAPALVAGNIYAPTKAAADLAVRCYAKIYGLRTACCRWMNTYGPGDTNWSRIVPATFARLARGERALIDGTDGTNVLELLHVRDMASAYLATAENLDNEEVSGEAFNFGSGQPITLRDAVVATARAWNEATGASVEAEPLITGPRVISRKYLDIEKARRVLGWTPQIALEDGLRETAAWYARHAKDARDFGAR